MKSTLYNLIVTIVLGMGLGAAQAQTTAPTGKITGSLITELGKPADYATVSLLRAKDSSIIKSSLSNEAGKYVIERVSVGTYLLKATIIGYNKTVSSPVTVTANSVVNVPVLKLEPVTNNLKAVSITATKPLIERKIDRTVINVENSVLAAGNSAMEILERGRPVLPLIKTIT
jgi:iron complex outermembrane receptor protein